MATTSIWRVHGWLGKLVVYVENPDKTENPAFTFRTFLLRLGLVGEEYKNVRMHLLKDLPGDPAWRYDRSQYVCLQNRRTEQQEAR